MGNSRGTPRFNDEQARTLRRKFATDPERYSAKAMAKTYGVELKLMRRLVERAGYEWVSEWSEDELAAITQHGIYPKYYDPKTGKWSMP